MEGMVRYFHLTLAVGCMLVVSAACTRLKLCGVELVPPAFNKFADVCSVLTMDTMGSAVGLDSVGLGTCNGGYNGSRYA